MVLLLGGRKSKSHDISQWRATKHSLVFTAELLGARVTNLKCCRACVQTIRDHKSSRFVETKLFLILQRAYTRHGTKAASHDINSYLSLLKRDGTFCSVEIPDSPVQISVFSVAGGRKNFTASASGGTKETQEMLDFCGVHNVVSEIEMTTHDKLAESWGRVIKGDVTYRFVLDNRSL
jgi:D-arabinose 1-dehydrogenase-like Zn-dependent alcohol dehydrogenase